MTLRPFEIDFFTLDATSWSDSWKYCLLSEWPTMVQPTPISFNYSAETLPVYAPSSN